MAEMKGGVTRSVVRDDDGNEKTSREEWHVKGTADAGGAVIKVAVPRSKKRLKLVEMRGYNLVSQQADDENYWLLQLEQAEVAVATMECREAYWHAQSVNIDAREIEGPVQVRVIRMGDPQGDLCIDIRVVAEQTDEGGTRDAS